MKLIKFFICISFLFANRAVFTQEKTQDTFTTQLWSTSQPVCILVHNPNHEKLQLPEPYTPPSISELLGPGVTEDQLIMEMNAQKFNTEKVQIGNNVTFAVTYADGSNEGFNDPTLGAARKSAFTFAMQVWANNLQGPATISVMATMSPRGGTAGAAVLASCAPAGYFKNFTNAPVGNTWYPECLTEIISGSDPNNNRLDINVDFNSDVDNNTVLGNRDFYYGTDASPGNDFDFVTVTIHELCHGLGFLDSFDSNGVYGGGTPEPFIYDRFLVDSTGTPLINKTSSANNVTGNNVFWNGITARYLYNKIFNTNTSIPMFAPTPFQTGSSVGHLDETIFTGIYELETPNSSSAVHTPDKIVLGILQDIGYSLPNSRYVDLSADGFEDGSCANPFNASWKGFVAVPQYGVLRLRANSYDVGSGNNGPATLDKPMTIASYGGVVTIFLSSAVQIESPGSFNIEETSLLNEDFKRLEIFKKALKNENK